MTKYNYKKNKPIIPITIFVVGLIIYVAIKLIYHKQISSQEIDTRLKSAAASLDLIISDSLIQNAHKKVPVNIVDYEDLRLQANKIAEIHNVIYVYVVIQSNDSVYFVVSSYITNDITKNIVTGYMDYYPEATPAMKKSFNSGATEIFDEQQDQWGVFHSLYIPKKTKTGIPYLLCADVKASELTDYRLRYLVEFALTALFLFLISLPLIISLRK
jgi:hypothetical protein